MALETSPTAPVAVRTVANAIGGWIDRLGAVWVEGQVAQLNRRPGMATVFLTLRDTVADISVPVQVLYELVRYFTRTLDHPDGTRLDASIPLPYRITELQLSPGQAVIVQ